jgi:hypothetical protein
MDEDSWQSSFGPDQQRRAISVLEDGGVVLFPRLGFTVTDTEKPFLLPGSVSAKAKNVSFDIRTGVMRGSALEGADARRLHDMLERYARHSLALVQSLLPHYGPTIEQARTSYRPVEAATRASSWRKDDRRLHVDAFPSSPNQGKRLLRVFSNINPAGKDRIWNVGESFETVANHYLPSVPRPLPGSAGLLRALRITKTLRSEYDHIMLRIHDRMKADASYQANAASTRLSLPPGATWLVYTDCVSHAALSGQFMMEQTFVLPVAGMLDPNRSPLRVLERIAGRALA